MYLKKVKLFGFKSFADEVEFELGKGLTAIVGPNGCGKSNVLDAINWVLGEQSASRLRGNEMMDMIFKGSKSRKPLGFAHVELVLDNSKDILPIDYNEVTVGRKIYRSGESEYYINKNQCRLKDVKQLFLDTGIGTRSYSVMEQDNVRFVLESSPVERRSIIEEAAGIRKYKEKKLEAERQVERTRDDLNEVKNIMAEVQKNIRRLKRQSAKARKYKNARRRLKNLEVSRLCQEYKKIKVALGGKTESARTLEENLSEILAEKTSLSSKVNKLEQNRYSVEQKLQQANRNIYKVDSKVEIINSRTEDFASGNERLDEERLRVKKTIEYNNQSLKRLQEELENSDANERNSKESELKAIKTELRKIHQTKNEANLKVEKIQDVIDSWQKDIARLERKEIEEKKTRESAVDQREKLICRKKELEKSCAEIKEKLKKFKEKEKNTRDNIDNIKVKIRGYEKEAKKIEDSMGSVSSDREKLLAKYHTIKSEYNSGKKYLPQLLSIERISKKKFKEIEGPLSSILEKKVNGLDLKRISLAAGDKMSWMIARSEKAAYEAVNFLKEQNLPPLTFVIPGKIPQTSESPLIPGELKGDYSKIIGYFLQGASENNGLMKISKCVISGGGEIPPRTGQLLSLEADIEEVKERLKEKEEKNSRLMERKREILKVLEDLKRNEINKGEKLSALKEEAGKNRGNYQFMKEEYDSVSKEIDSIEIKSPRSFRILGEKIKGLTSKLEEKRMDLTREREVADSVNKDFIEMQARKKAIEELVHKKKQNVENLLREKKRLIEDNKKLRDLTEDLLLKKKKRKDQHSRDVVEIQSLKKKKNMLNEEINRLESEKRSMSSNLREAKRELGIKAEKADKLRDEISQKKQIQGRFRERLSSIEERLLEDMNTHIDDAMGNYSKEPVDENEIKKLKEQLENIGDSVNLQAPVQLEKEEERYEFIQSHVTDLEKAGDDIKRIIRQINKKTRDRFIDAFEKINVNFGKIFSKLFEGGKAELLLEDPENILESGIVIRVNPEGKKLTSLKLISGGESALTAIALMFAIYEVKPTPFCVLDEVDAPLDDTYLHRFLRMLKGYTRTTQFIIVTHNKQTMKMCDTFYGITMEEFGVSKTISVKLQHAS